MTGPQTGRGRNQKGNRAELAVVKWLQTERGFIDAERVRSGRSLDPGDIVWADANGQTCPWLLDCKDRGTWSVPAWWREIVAEADNQNLQPLLVIKRPGMTDPGEWLAVTRLRDLEL